MREPGVGRLLVASLHQAISEVLPLRLGFYESFLPPEGLREGTIGVAPVSAVISFLRREGGAYDLVVARAGQYAAEWTVESMVPFERRLIASAPEWLRARLVLRVGGRLVRRTCEQSRATARLRRRTARVELSTSMFCTVREPVNAPLCGYYAAAFARLLTVFALPTQASVESCRGTGVSGPHCVLTLSLARVSVSPLPKETAA